DDGRVGWAKSPQPVRVGTARARFYPGVKIEDRAFAHPTSVIGPPSAAQLVGEVAEIGRSVIDGSRWRGFAPTGSVLVGPRNVRRAQPALRSSKQVVGVRRDHGTIRGLQVEGIACGEIDARFWLVVAGDLGSENGIPGKLVAPGQVDHQRDIPV